MLREFREFALRGNVVDLAVGVIIGSTFGSIVNSLVGDVLLPPIGMLLGNVDFSNLYLLLRQGDPVGPYTSLAEAQISGAVTINYGTFINTVITFAIVSSVVFLLIRGMNRLQRDLEDAPAEAPSRHCPYCMSSVHSEATRCSQCTSELESSS